MKEIMIILDIQFILHQIMIIRMKVSQIRWNKISKNIITKTINQIINKMILQIRKKQKNRDRQI